MQQIEHFYIIISLLVSNHIILIEINSKIMSNQYSSNKEDSLHQDKQYNQQVDTLEHFPIEIDQNIIQIEKQANITLTEEIVDKKQQQVIQLDSIKLLYKLHHEQIVPKLCKYFPQVKNLISEMTFYQVAKFLNWFTHKYGTQEVEEVIQYHYPPKKTMINISVELLPELKDEINAMDDKQLKQLFDDIMSELKRETQAKVFKFEYLENHPFQVKTMKEKNIKVVINYNEIIQFIKQSSKECQDFTLPLVPQIMNKRTFDEMNSTNRNQSQNNQKISIQVETLHKFSKNEDGAMEKIIKNKEIQSQEKINN